MITTISSFIRSMVLFIPREVRVVLVVALLELDRQEALVPLQLGDLPLGVAVLALQHVELSLE